MESMWRYSRKLRSSERVSVSSAEGEAAGMRSVGMVGGGRTRISDSRGLRGAES